jgi:hypothetical protein
MALWKKTSSGQGDPPGPLGKYITMYNKAVKTLGTDNPEVLKNFFASQQYGQNNTQVQQNNNINKAPQQKESKIGNVAGDIGTLSLSTLQNFGMNIPGDVIKTVAPKAAILDVLPQTTTNQYVKQRNQSLGQNIKDVGDAANTVAAFEMGAPLLVREGPLALKELQKLPYKFISGKTLLNKVTDPIMKTVYKPLVKKAANQVTNYVKNSNKEIYKDLKNITSEELINATQVKPFESKTALAYYNRGHSYRDPRYFNLSEADYLRKPQVVINPYKHITRNPLKSLRHEYSHYYDYKGNPVYDKLFKNSEGIFEHTITAENPRSVKNHLLPIETKDYRLPYYEQPTEVMARIFTNKSVGKHTIDQYDRLIRAGWENSQLSKLWKKYSLVPPTVSAGVGLSLQNKNTKQ